MDQDTFRKELLNPFWTTTLVLLVVSLFMVVAEALGFQESVWHYLSIVLLAQGLIYLRLMVKLLFMSHKEE